MVKRIRTTLLSAAVVLSGLAFGQQPSMSPASPAKHPPTGVPQIVRNAKDLGRVDPNTSFDHLHLLLVRTPEQTSALDQELENLHRPASPEFHQWMTAAEYGRRYGVSSARETAVTTWLIQQGFQVEGIDPARMTIQFSGKASQIENAFGTEIHNLQIGTESHVSNTTELHIPTSLSSAVRGVSLSDFKPHSLLTGARSVQRQSNGTYMQVGEASAGSTPSLTTTYDNETFQLVTPGDFAQIYNLNPLWNAGYRGAGQTLVVLEDTLMNAPDVGTFRAQFGLTKYAGTFSQISPAGSHPCGAPGITANSTEAALDAQWAGAVAPDAQILLAACADTQTQFGGLTALQNLLVAQSVPKVMSISYGNCEAEMGAIQLQEFAQTFQQAVAEGVTVLVSSGDAGSAGCDDHAAAGTHGNSINGFGSTPFNVSVGGTDFFDYLQGTVSTYWSQTNSDTYVSALSYIPEKSWNTSCADSSLLEYVGYAVAYGPNGFCNSNEGYPYLDTGGGSGGSSTVYAKPDWQTTYGVPSDGARDIPDVSLFASDGFYGHGLVFCNTQKKFYGVPCDFSNPANAVMDYAGGTSFASPAMAGIITLINQKYGPQGNANVGLYALANQEYGTQGAPLKSSLAACNSTNGKGADSSCVFYDITQGSITVPCQSIIDCYGSSGTYSDGQYQYTLYGVESLDSSEFVPAYQTQTGFDLATGIGSVNANNLVNGWANVATTGSAAPPSPALTSTTLQLSTSTVAQGEPITLTATVGSSAGTPSGTVTFMNGTVLLGSETLNNGVATYATSSQVSGTYQLSAQYVGAATFSPSSSSSETWVVTATVTVVPGFSVLASTPTVAVSTGGEAVITLSLTPLGGYSGTLKLACPTPPSGIACSFAPQTVSVSPSTGPVDVALTVRDTQAMVAVSMANQQHGPLDHVLLLSASMFGFPGLFALAALRRKGKLISGPNKLLLLLVFFGVLGALSGCGRGVTQKSTGSSVSYPLTVTVTGSGGVAQTIGLTVISQSQ